MRHILAMALVAALSLGAFALTASAEDPAPVKDAQESTCEDPLDDRSPEGLYKSFCSNCHDPGIAGAPKTADTTAWDKLLKARGYDKLVENTVKGIGVMPAKGTCVECSDAEIKAVVDFMLKKAKVAVPPAKPAPKPSK